MASYTDITNTLAFAVSFKPTSAFPIDARSMFGSKAAAEAAAATAVDAGSSDSIYYHGMPLTVFDNDEATMYVINGDNTLKEVGKATYGDDKTIVLDASTGKLSLASFGEQYFAYHDANDDHENAYYELVTGWKDGLTPKVIGNADDGYSLAWYEPSTTTVEGLSTAIETLQSNVSNIDDRVSTNETDISTLKTSVESNTSAIETLTGDADTEGSVSNQIATAVANIMDNPDETMNSIKELVDWCDSHASDALSLSNDVTANATAIEALQTLVGELPDGISATTVIGYITEAVNAVSSKLGTASEKDVDYFATAEQGAKADSAVQSVTAGTENGHISVDGTDVKVYEAPTASTETAGVVKVDGTTISVSNGVASIEAVPINKITDFDTTVGTAISNAIDELELGDTYLPKDDVVAAADLSGEVDDASDEKAASEKALVEALTWKTTM